MTVADVNVDMVGRQDDKYKDNPDYIYVIGLIGCLQICIRSMKRSMQNTVS